MSDLTAVSRRIEALQTKVTDKLWSFADLDNEVIQYG